MEGSFLKFTLSLSAFMVICLTISAILSPISCTTTKIQVQEPQYSIEDFGSAIAKQTVRVRTSETTGSGTFISQNYILTAFHVVQNKDEAFIDIPGRALGLKCEVLILGEITSLDYAILKLIDPLPEEFEVTIAATNFDEEFHVGAEIYFAGYPQGQSLHITTGILSSISRTFYKSSAPVMFGQSGGGVYDRHGHLVGIISRMGQLSNGYFQFPIYHESYYVPIHSVIKDLDKRDELGVFKKYQILEQN